MQTIYRTNHARNKPMPKQTKETCNTNFINLSIYGATKITSTVTSCSTKAQTSLSSHTSTKQQPPHTWSRVTKPKVPRTSPRVHKTRTISNSARKINKLLELTKRTHKKGKTPVRQSLLSPPLQNIRRPREKDKTETPNTISGNMARLFGYIFFDVS